MLLYDIVQMTALHANKARQVTAAQPLTPGPAKI